jgi:hypothetical protein
VPNVFVGLVVLQIQLPVPLTRLLYEPTLAALLSQGQLLAEAATDGKTARPAPIANVTTTLARAFLLFVNFSPFIYFFLL